jgi:hypothetical protein
VTAPLRATAGELTTSELMTLIEDGTSVIMQAEVMGRTHTVTLRASDGTYYCDTPTKLHRHTDPAEMITCIESMGYTQPG